jgi:type IV pilus assembly protein PilB
VQSARSTGPAGKGSSSPETAGRGEAPARNGNAPAYNGDAPVRGGDTPTHKGDAPVHKAGTPAHQTETPAHKTDIPADKSDAPVRNGREPAGLRQPWGEILVSRGVITRDQLTRALFTQRGNGMRLGEVLRSMGVTSRHIAEALSEQLGVPVVRLFRAELDESVVRMIPEHLARRHQALAIAATDSRITVALVDPFDVIVIDDIRRLTGREVDVVVTPAEDFDIAVSRYLAFDRDPRPAEDPVLPAQGEDTIPAPDALLQMGREAPIVRLASQIIGQGIGQRASDIHIEAQERDVRVRFRIDGVLSNAMTVAKHLHAAVISRLKILGGMDIAEQRLPQDGRIRIRSGSQEVDIRVSTIPGVHGENAVMRLMTRQRTMTLDELGLSPHDRGRVEEMMKRPHGIFLMTGPTGSGKTNSLYAILNMLNTPDRKILTIEDPVEYNMPGLMQVQVNTKTGLTFAAGLRAFLRHDPDIIMVGEIRDKETAMIAIQAALTGHLVLSTLHTNDAAAVVSRLLDMGVEPYLLASTLLGAGAQRLVRVLCPECREGVAVDAETAAWLGVSARELPQAIYRARGCPTCQDSGYWGRTGIFEIMRVTDKMRAGIARRMHEHEIRKMAAEDGTVSLLADGSRKVAAGLTSVNEVLRVINVADAEKEPTARTLRHITPAS